MTSPAAGGSSSCCWISSAAIWPLAGLEFANPKALRQQRSMFARSFRFYFLIRSPYFFLLSITVYSMRSGEATDWNGLQRVLHPEHDHMFTKIYPHSNNHGRNHRLYESIDLCGTRNLITQVKKFSSHWWPQREVTLSFQSFFQTIRPSTIAVPHLGPDHWMLWVLWRPEPFDHHQWRSYREKLRSWVPNWRGLESLVQLHNLGFRLVLVWVWSDPRCVTQ